jgi:hypothetical protein
MLIIQQSFLAAATLYICFVLCFDNRNTSVKTNTRRIYEREKRLKPNIINTSCSASAAAKENFFCTLVAARAGHVERYQLQSYRFNPFFVTL